jgi:hypothetical protein
MDSNYLFGSFKLVLHIISKELLALVLATLAKFDTTLTSHLGFPDPKYLFLLLLNLSVPTNKDLQTSSPKSDLSVLENLFSHNRELSVLSILDLA